MHFRDIPKTRWAVLLLILGCLIGCSKRESKDEIALTPSGLVQRLSKCLQAHDSAKLSNLATPSGMKSLMSSADDFVAINDDVSHDDAVRFFGEFLEDHTLTDVKDLSDGYYRIEFQHGVPPTFSLLVIRKNEGFLLAQWSNEPGVMPPSREGRLRREATTEGGGGTRADTGNKVK